MLFLAADYAFLFDESFGEHFFSHWFINLFWLLGLRYAGVLLAVGNVRAVRAVDDVYTALKALDVLVSLFL